MKRNDYTFYTPVGLAKKLLKLLPDISINTIIDICCGSWSLLSVGKEKYPDALIIGVDIDSTSLKYKIDGSLFFLMDGRDFASSEYKNNKAYDLILSNPPFGAIRNGEEKYEYDDEIKNTFRFYLPCNRYECELIQANLLLAHEGSVIVFILPSTFVTGDSFQMARCELSKEFFIHSIVKLPLTAFAKRRVGTYAIIMQKANREVSTILYEASYQDDWKLDKICEKVHSDVLEGNWWLAHKQSCAKSKRVIRGTISSNNFCEHGQKVYHCAAKSGNQWIPSIRYFREGNFPKNIVIAEKGDVIINRIGRDAGYWCQNSRDDIPVSDCLIIIKNATEAEIRILNKSSDSTGKLNIPIHGLSTPYITKQDILYLLDGATRQFE